MLRKIILLFIGGVFIIQTSSAAGTARNSSPNIIFVLVDDLGWGDLGIFYQNGRDTDKKHLTPELDRFGLEGAQLRSHYCPAPICAPSRASLLSGRHQGHESIRNMQFDKALADSHNLAKMLKAVGYQTVLVGKYGLQGGEKHVRDYESWTAYPTKRGFDEFFGYVMHIDGHTQYPDHKWPIGDTERHREKRFVYHNEREITDGLDYCYSTDLFTAYAKKWIVDHRRDNPGTPFFLFLSHSTPHAALQTPTGPYPKGGGLNGGIQWIGRPGKMISTANRSIDSWIHPDYRDKGWLEVEERFASSVRRIDTSMGDLIKTLEDLGIDENTMVVFSSDNGPHNQSYIKDQDYAPTSFESYGPFNGIKADTLEGGIRVPTLVRWPNQVKERTVIEAPSQFHDWMPTLAGAVGIAAPALSDGISILPSLLGEDQLQESTVYVEFMNPGKTPDYGDFEERYRGNRRRQTQALFMDGYKGVRYDIKGHEDDFEIYDIERDPREANNLADTSPYFEKLQTRMKARVLRLRRPDSSAPRPYDDEYVPAIDSSEVFEGVKWRVFEGEFHWVPQVSGLIPMATGISESVQIDIRTRNDYLAIEYRGFIKAEKRGRYEFSLNSDSGAVMRLHEAVIVDNETRAGGFRSSSGEILLDSGYHPFQIIYHRVDQGIPMLEFSFRQL